MEVERVKKCSRVCFVCAVQCLPASRRFHAMYMLQRVLRTILMLPKDQSFQPSCLKSVSTSERHAPQMPGLQYKSKRKQRKRIQRRAFGVQVSCRVYPHLMYLALSPAKASGLCRPPPPRPTNCMLSLLTCLAPVGCGCGIPNGFMLLPFCGIGMVALLCGCWNCCCCS